MSKIAVALSLLGGNQTSHFVPTLNQLHRQMLHSFQNMHNNFTNHIRKSTPRLTCSAGMLNISILYKLKYIFVPLKTKTVSRAFSIASPALWNALPEPIHNAQTILTFRKIIT